MLGGGKFENGAITGAFGYLFNHALRNSASDARRQEMRANIAKIMQAQPITIFDAGGQNSIYHIYQTEPILICQASAECTFANVLASALAKQVPGYQGVTEDKGLYPVTLPYVGYIGDVQVFVDGTSVFNVTTPGHWLWYGYIERQIQVESTGIYIQTFGEGANVLGPSVATTNGFFGPVLFTSQAELTRQTFQNRFGR